MKRTIDFSHAPPSRWTCIGRPDDDYKTVVREDGALLYQYAQPVRAGRLSGMFHTEVSFKVPCASAPVAITQTNDDPGNSIVVTKLQYPQATLTMWSFGHATPDGQRTDVVLWRIEATKGARDWTACLAVAPVYHRYRSAKVDTTPAVDTLVIEDALPEIAPPVRMPLIMTMAPESFRRSADPMDWYNFAAGYNLPPTAALSRMALLKADEALEGAVLLPQNYDDHGRLNYAWAKRALAAERAYWKKLRLPRLAIEVPDPAVQDMIRACARNILQAREMHDGLPEFQVGPTCYRNMWVVDGYYLLQMARYLGLPDDAERGTRALLRRVQEDGSIRDIPEHTMETMISVATLVRQAELANDRATLLERWAIIMKAVAFMMRLREESRKAAPGSPERGLLPKAYADGGIGGIRAEFLTTLWTLAGLNIAARGARWLGREQDAQHIQDAFASLMQDFRVHAARDMRTLPDGTPYLRMWRGDQSDHVIKPEFKGRLMPWQKLGLTSGAWAFSQAIYTGEIMPPDDPLVKNLVHVFDLVDDRQGLPEGMGWLLDRSIWPYGGAFAAQVWLYAGRPDKAADYLYAFANHAAPTRVWREEQSLDFTGHGQCNGDMPHNWASAEFIHLVRAMLVVERGEELIILSGLPAEWAKPGMRTRVEKTPTRFGPVSMTLAVDARGRGTIRLKTGKGSFTPAGIRVRLPDGVDRKHVIADGKPVRPDRRQMITLSPRTNATITFTLRKS